MITSYMVMSKMSKLFFFYYLIQVHLTHWYILIYVKNCHIDLPIYKLTYIIKIVYKRKGLVLMKMGMYKFIKRFADIIISVFGMIFLIPISFGVWIANMINGDFGPLVFKNKRVGINGKTIYVYKYRSMCVNAEKVLEDLMASDPKVKEEYLTKKKLENDPRVTKVGKFIRKTSIDELPQLINVFLGNMSIVGPRPYLPREIPDMGDNYQHIIKCKPGITGLWQVSGRSDVEFVERTNMDVVYEKKRSLWFDIKIFFKTFIVVLFGKGAK